MLKALTIALSLAVAHSPASAKTQVETEVDTLVIVFSASKVCGGDLAQVSDAVFPALARIFMERYDVSRSEMATLISVRAAKVIVYVETSDISVRVKFCQNVSDGKF